MSQIRTGNFISGGGAYNLVLGFVPSYLKLFNFMAAAGEVAVVEWFSEHGDAKEIQWKMLADNGTTSSTTFTVVASGGVVAAYNASTVSTGPPVVVTGGKGVTIATGWLDDNDVIYYLAIEADRDVDHGDESP